MRSRPFGITLLILAVLAAWFLFFTAIPSISLSIPLSTNSVGIPEIPATGSENPLEACVYEQHPDPDFHNDMNRLSSTLHKYI